MCAARTVAPALPHGGGLYRHLPASAGLGGSAICPSEATPTARTGIRTPMRAMAMPVGGTGMATSPPVPPGAGFGPPGGGAPGDKDLERGRSGSPGQ